MDANTLRKGLISTSKAPLRYSDSHRSEMVSELLFGEVVEIIAEKGDWYLIENSFDHYQGYVDKLQIELIEEDIFKKIKEENNPYFLKETQLYSNDKGMYLLLPKGGILPLFDGNQFFWKGEYHSLQTANVRKAKNEDALLSIAKEYLGTSYMWGGRSQFGIDCSGFVQMVFRQKGVPLLRDASQQAKDGENVLLLEEAQSGDLAFFDNEEGNITHVGIIIDKEYIIHASSEVRIDKLDHHGIFRTDTQHYSHQLRLIKRYSF